MIYMSDECHKWKSLANHLMSDPKIIIHGNSWIIFMSYMLFYVLNTPFFYKQSLITHFAIDTKDSLF